MSTLKAPTQARRRRRHWSIASSMMVCSIPAQTSSREQDQYLMWIRFYFFNLFFSYENFSRNTNFLSNFNLYIKKWDDFSVVDVRSARVQSIFRVVSPPGDCFVANSIFNKTWNFFKNQASFDEVMAKSSVAWIFLVHSVYCNNLL